jgi:Protein of unknown function (DUF3768)
MKDTSMTTSQSIAATTANPAVMQAEATAQLNDEMRRNPFGVGKRTVVTRGVNHMGPEFTRRALAAVAAFDQFSSGNNVHRERDYGAFTLDSYDLMFKIDYLDVDGLYASDDPSDPAQTLRVMTIMFASEY